jgi:CDP-glycerol glycerophosphotransferase (TagB/SpsB family)
MFWKILSLMLLPLNWTIYLISHLSPRNPTLIAFGVQTTSYSGNVRALFEEQSPHLNKVFISSSKALANELKSNDMEAYWRYSYRGALTCLRAKHYVYSSYPSDINFWLSGGARLANVWHGTPIKKIEKDISTGYYGFRNRHDWLVKLVAPYLLKKPDALLVSSQYEEECFNTAFDVDRDLFVRSFPPRLSGLVGNEPSRNQSIKILYAPTWRDDHSFLITDYLNFETFSAFLENNNVHLCIKLHPADKTVLPDTNMARISILGKQGDIYQQLKVAQLVVTDYSSIMFDALYLGKSVILFTPDIDRYQKNSRSFYIDPPEDLGLKNANSQQALEHVIEDHFKQTIQPINLLDRFSPYPIREDLQRKLLDKCH